jgi:hypothetical protein
MTVKAPPAPNRLGTRSYGHRTKIWAKKGLIRLNRANRLNRAPTLNVWVVVSKPRANTNTRLYPMQCITIHCNRMQCITMRQWTGNIYIYGTVICVNKNHGPGLSPGPTPRPHYNFVNLNIFIYIHVIRTDVWPNGRAVGWSRLGVGEVSGSNPVDSHYIF